jgi:hypothetical protein
LGGDPKPAETSPPETFGCEANPTGDPIGGGSGYHDIFHRGDFTVTDADQFLAALKQAKAGQVIFIPGQAEIDLTGKRSLVIPGGVTLAGTRGLDGSLGGKIQALQRETFGLFVSGGPQVRITGLRFEGPYAERDTTGFTTNLVTFVHHRGEVDNCEIYNWNCDGVCGRAGATKLHVHHCSIHHIQLNGYGYGVSLGTSDARIIANRFEFCRHHIAGTGAPGTSYEAAYNLVLDATSHLFDMHGGRDRGDRTNIAGDWIEIHHNTFQSPMRAVGIRGTPSQHAEIYHNWFTKPAKETIFSGGNTRVWRNVYGPDRKLEE